MTAKLDEDRFTFRTKPVEPTKSVHWVKRTLRLRGPTSENVEGFGCRPIAAMRLSPWPASESLQ
jgi:hypothetical protein